MKLFFSLITSLLLTSTAQAMTSDEAKAALAGTWGNHSELYIFDDSGSWKQFVGGAEYAANVSFEGMPGNLFKMKSSSGKTYIVHFHETHFQLFPEGSPESIGQFFKRD